MERGRRIALLWLVDLGDGWFQSAAVAGWLVGGGATCERASVSRVGTAPWLARTRSSWAHSHRSLEPAPSVRLLAASVGRLRGTWRDASEDHRFVAHAAACSAAIGRARIGLDEARAGDTTPTQAGCLPVDRDRVPAASPLLLAQQSQSEFASQPRRRSSFAGARRPSSAHQRTRGADCAGMYRPRSCVGALVCVWPSPLPLVSSRRPPDWPPIGLRRHQLHQPEHMPAGRQIEREWGSSMTREQRVGQR